MSNTQFNNGLRATRASLLRCGHFCRQHLALVIIALPVLLLSMYLLLLSQPRFMSSSSVVVKRADDISASSMSIGLLMGGASSGTAEDALYLKAYIHSPDMLNILDKELGLRAAFADSGLDIFNHLSTAASAERFLDYYRHRVSVNWDDKAGLLTIDTQGFSAAFALAFNQAVLRESQRFINELSHRVAREQLHFAVQEMEQARARLEQSKKALLRYQSHNNMLDPTASAVAASSLVNTLLAQKIQREADLRNLKTFLRADAPQVVSAANAIAALDAQIEDEKRKITAPQGNPLNQLAVTFETLKGEVAFHQDLYQMALAATEKTRIESARTLKVLSVISSPQLPEETTYPAILYTLASALLTCCLLFGTVRLVLAVIDDHRD